LSIEDVIRERGPMTVAAFMDLALYDRQLGYYARAPRRSGRAGDFFTSVDVGPLFGELLAVQVAQCFELLAVAPSAPSRSSASLPSFDLVEAGAGNGRLAADMLRGLHRHHPALGDRVHLHLVDASPEARRAQRDTLGDLSNHLVASSDSLPASYEGVLVANELLDALAVHQVVMRQEGLREVYVCAVDSRQSTVDGQQSSVDSQQSSVVTQRPPVAGRRSLVADRQSTVDCRLSTVEGPISTPALEEYFARLGVVLEPDWRAEINLRAVQWIQEAARRLRRGFLVIIDYGHEARHLYSVSHATGTLTTFSNHTMAGPELQTPRWLERPGEQDLTAHVDFTSVRAAAEKEGLVTLGFMDQTYFLLGLMDDAATLSFSQRLALKTLTMPGGLGSTHKVLILGKNVGAPSLRGCSFGQRVT
jgi:SAM-dependent MidA family methyltransferase